MELKMLKLYIEKEIESHQKEIERNAKGGYWWLCEDYRIKIEVLKEILSLL